MKSLAISLLVMFRFHYTIAVILLLAIETPELWIDEDEDDDDEILLFYQTLMRTFLHTQLVFLKLCQVLDIYSTSARNLLLQHGNYPRE